MKTWTEQMILELIERADNKVLFKMLHGLYERQTAHEQSAEYTRDRNDVGFNAYDAKFLTSVAKNGEKYGQVSDGQKPHIRKALRRYRKQLVDIANMNERQREAAPGRIYQPKNDFAKADEDSRGKLPWAGQFVNRMDREIDKIIETVKQVQPVAQIKTQAEIDKQEREMNEMVAKSEKEQEEAAYRSKMLRDQALQGNLYQKSWDEVFKAPCGHEWGEYIMKDVPMLEARWHRKYHFTSGSPMRGCHNQVCTKCGEYQFIDSSD